MSYEHYKSSLVIVKSPKEQYTTHWQAFVDENIGNASNWYDIEVESALGTQEFIDAKARITYAINPTTGLKLSDDWKQFIFQNPLEDNVKMGKRFRFEDNIWLTINSEKYGSLTDNCIVRRCNNILSMKLADGTVHQEPCAIDNGLKYGNIYFNNAVNVTQGTISVWVQANKFTKDIDVNDRFILGYNKVFKVKAVINYLSDYTYVKDGAPLMQFEMEVDSILAGDDFVNGLTQTTTYDAIGTNGYIKVTPDEKVVFQGETSTFVCKYYNNETPASNTFVFSLVDTGIPQVNYEFIVIDDNTFTIRNIKKYFGAKLNVLCTDSLNSNLKTTIEIELGGAY